METRTQYQGWVLLTNASGRKLNRVLVRRSSVDSIQEPENTDNVGCILGIGENLFPVKESFDTCCQLICLDLHV